MVYTQASARPPVLDEMMPDITRLIHSVATRYHDATCANLHIDEMEGEARLKLAELIDRGEVERQCTRADFFCFLKASLNNQARSRVQKYRFTEKRTGVKPPPRHQRFNKVQEHDEEEDEAVITQEHTKNVELSLDDPNINLQVAQPETSDEQSYRDLMDDYETLLTPVEVLVFRQLAEPNALARVYAQVDSNYKKMRDKISIRIRHEHLAIGLGMALELFEEAVLSIRQKIAAYKAMSDADIEQQQRFNALIAQLKTVFGLQIPQGTDDITVRRMLTMAARDQLAKVNEQVAEMLEQVGAKVPRQHGDKISCYGVLYNRNHPCCTRCGLRQSCMVEAVNIGMTMIQPSRKLLGAKQTRMPVALPESFDEEGQDTGIVAYLDTTFRRMTTHGQIFYTYQKADTDSQKMLFCVDESTQSVRFCGPTAAMKKKLAQRGRNFYAPEALGPMDVVQLIDEHAKENLK